MKAEGGKVKHQINQIIESHVNKINMLTKRQRCQDEILKNNCCHLKYVECLRVYIGGKNKQKHKISLM